MRRRFGLQKHRGGLAGGWLQEMTPVAAECREASAIMLFQYAAQKSVTSVSKDVRQALEGRLTDLAILNWAELREGHGSHKDDQTDCRPENEQFR